MREEHLDVSVIIVNFNTKDILKNCIDSIIRESSNFSYEIIVVDNGSTDGSTAMVKENFPEAKLVENRENIGFAAANNQGVQIAKGKFILFLNSDTVIIDNAIKGTLDFMRQKDDIGIVGCKLLNSDMTLQPSCYFFPSLFRHTLVQKAIPRILVPRKFHDHIENMITRWDYGHMRDVDYVRGAFLMIRRSVFEEIGLLDEDFFMYGEEADFCWRVKDFGWRVVFFPGASVIHLGGASVKLKGHEIMQRTVSDLLFRKKHYGMFVFLAYRGLLFLRFGVEFLFFSAWGRGKAKRIALSYQLKGIRKLSYKA